MTTQRQRWLAVMLVLAAYGVRRAACGVRRGRDRRRTGRRACGEVVADDGTGEVQLAEPDPSAATCPGEPCEVIPLEVDAGEDQPEPDAGLEESTPGSAKSAVKSVVGWTHSMLDSQRPLAARLTVTHFTQLRDADGRAASPPLHL